MEPPLHQAVLNSDYPVIEKLASSLPALHTRNTLGFTALEIARFLGKKEIVEILAPGQTAQIRVLKWGARQSKKLSEIEFKEFFKVEYRSHLHFPNYFFFKSTLKNCPWILKSSSFGIGNRELAEQYRKELFIGEKAPVTVQWIDEELGYGLFAAADLFEGTYVGEFTGQVRRLYRSKPQKNAYCFHYPTRFWSWHYTIVDALKEGNETRFINHSDTPNLQPLCLCERSLLHLVFVAKQNIPAGTQLTYDYGPDFWRYRS